MGHPKPFHLTHIEVGNEENLPNEFFARFTEFRTAIEAKYPDITVISNSGPDDSGSTFDTAWKLNRDANVDMVDEHYYNSPQWFLQNNDRYDSYDRNGPKVFLGEYASQGNTFKNALTEAAFMTGLERNADVVKLASYAPLLANEDYVQWRPDMIWFNNHASWGSAIVRGAEAVHDQRRRPGGAHHRHRHALGERPDHGRRRPVDLGDHGGVRRREGHRRGRHGAARATTSRATPPGGPIPGAGAGRSRTGSTSRRDVAAENTMVTAGDPAWHDYDLHVKATKKSGKEGFLVAFGVKDTGNYYWWNLGGWNNTLNAVEQAIGRRQVDARVQGRLDRDGPRLRHRRQGAGPSGHPLPRRPGVGQLHRRQAGRAVPPDRHQGREDR